MTKRELIKELNSVGCFDPEIEAMSKKELEDKLQIEKTVKTMSLSDLVAHLSL